MQDEKLNGNLEPPQSKMIGLVSSVEKSSDDADVWQADIVPLAIWNDGKWMSKESMLAKNNPLQNCFGQKDYAQKRNEVLDVNYCMEFSI